MAFDLLGNLANLGFFDLILPWTLFFAIIYGLLGKVNLFGDKSEKINLVIAVAMAFFGVNYTTVGANVGLFLTNLFGIGGLGLSVILLIAIMLPLLGGDDKLMKFFEIKFDSWANFLGSAIKLGVVFLVVGIGAYFFTGKGLSLPSLSLPYIGSDLVTTVLILLLMIGVVAFVFWNTEKPTGGSRTQAPPAAGAHG